MAIFSRPNALRSKLYQDTMSYVLEIYFLINFNETKFINNSNDPFEIRQKFYS